jgi:CBS domain-containing protein
LGALLGKVGSTLLPRAGIDPRIAALVGMAAIFAGASRALLASVVFAFETTRQPLGLLPLLAGCTAAYLVSIILMKHTIMTERLARRGTPVRQEYAVDYLEQILVQDIATSPVATLNGSDLLGQVRQGMARRSPGFTHQGYPVLNAGNELIGVVTARDLLDPAQPDSARVDSIITRPPIVIFETNSARQAADQMVRARIGRLPVVAPGAVRTVKGIVTRSDLLEAHEQRLVEEDQSGRHLEFSLRHGLQQRPK